MAYATKEDKAAHGRRYYAANKAASQLTRKMYYEERKVANPMEHIVRTSRSRAKRYGIPHTITAADVPMPLTCAVLGIPLFTNPDRTVTGACDNSPSIDQIIPRLGYVPGNVRVISYRANRLKCDATLEEMELIIADLRNLKERLNHGT